MRNCWRAFWGPFRPLFGGHTLEEVGASYYLPTWILIVSRFSSAGAMFAFLVAYFHFARASFLNYLFDLWEKFVLLIAFGLLGVSSIMHRKFMDPEKLTSFGAVAVPCVQVSASAALFSIFLQVVSSVAVRGMSLNNVAFIFTVVSFGLVITDIALGARINPRWSYFVVFLLITALYLVGIGIAFRGQVGVGLLLIIALGIVSGILVIAAYRIGGCLAQRSKKSASDEGETLDKTAETP